VQDTRPPSIPVNAGERINDERVSETSMRADRLMVVAPEYNQGKGGMLKYVSALQQRRYTAHG
jgi:NAD(P)H-dependent FMN reductase